MIVAVQALVFFRENLITALDRLVRPYFKQLTLGLFAGNGNDLEDEEADDQVFSEYDEEKGVTFYPPMYAQRYAAVSDCLLDDRWCGQIEKVVDFGHHDMSFIKYLKEVPGIHCILGVDIESIPLRCSSDLLGGDEYSSKREEPLHVTLFQGNAADPDYRLIGCDAVIAIEMIEHMLPHDLERFVHTVFGFIKPRIVIFTTPNSDFNILFKALEKNGLRRLDHLFEWTREQFHDWCSNIVTRYPNYLVTCKGIGPGPPGTLHYGCCSQLSLFIAKDYNKQADLNLNCLASQLVANGQTRNEFSEIFEGSWESTVSQTSPNRLECVSPEPQTESLAEIIYPEEQSHVTLFFSTTLCNSGALTDKTFTMDPFSYHDLSLQCNLDVEVGKSYMMFDWQDYYNVVEPRRRVSHKVYEIEDVYSRLNCSTLQVKKFSKTTQNLMAKNRIDSIVHTREVVNEIRHLTKALNFNNFSQAEDGGHVWCNINWGENAPYWNQYYKIVREYAYPFEIKSEESRILDLVSEEINRLIDAHFDEESSVDVNRLEIPLAHLMNGLQHITNDVGRVRDLLEWNGYEIVDDVIIHSRLVVDTTSVVTHEDDWPENDFSDWDTTDLRTPSVSDGSTVVVDLPGRCLRRALDQKVRNLRTMLSVDEDITTELDKVVCRLMKLALHSSMDRQTPPPSRWLQCKLLDLLTLTEKAISRRKMCFIESIPWKRDQQPDAVVKQDSRVKELVDKYSDLLHPLIEIATTTDDVNEHITDVDVEDEFLSTTSNEFLKENEYVVGMSPSLVIPRPVFSTETFVAPELTPDANPLERTEAWLAEDVKVEPDQKYEINCEDISSGDTDHTVSKVRHKHKKSIKKHKTSNKSLRESGADTCKRTLSNTSCKLKIKREYRKYSKTQITKKMARKKSNYTNMVENPDGEYSSAEYDNYVIGSKRTDIRYQTFNVAASKPIPESLIKLCHSDLKLKNGFEPLGVTDNADKTNVVSVSSCISATQESFHIDIVMQDFEETIALRRTIGTDTKVPPQIKSTRGTGSFSDDFDEKLCTKHEVSTENVQSQTIFLNDINEPSTSKGIRHNMSTDVQCGPDSLASYPLLSPRTSVAEMPQVFSTGIKINDISTDIKVKGTDFGTSTQETNDLKTITARFRPVGIKIKDSDVNICSQTECSTMTISESVPQIFATNCSSALHSAVSSNATKLLKPVSSTLKIEDSASELCTASIASTSNCMTESKTTNNVLMELSESKEEGMDSPSKMLKLACGAIHVHSYTDKEVSEDVVYQGEWQRPKPKANNTRKNTLNFSTAKRANEAVAKKTKETLKEKKVNSKEKLYRRRQEKKQVEAEPQMRNIRLRKVSQEVTSTEVKKPRVSKGADKISATKSIPRPIKTAVKVSSKHAISANTSKNAKSTFTIKRSAILANVNTVRNNDKQQKSYIPLYLKRNLRKEQLNKSLDSASDAMKDSVDKLADKLAPLVRSNTEEIRKDLLKFSNDQRANISYVVWRNDLEDKIKSPDEQTSENSKDNKSTPKQLDMLKRFHSSNNSINSSTCSSPNSIATVRAASTRAKVMTKRHSAQPHKGNVANNESDNSSPPKTKKIFKRYKSAKKTENKDIGNKENIPESTQNFVNNKDKEKIIKLPFTGTPKSVCVAQIETECSSPPIVRQKAQISNKCNAKVSSRKDSDEKRRGTSPSVSKKRSLKSETSIHDNFVQSESESSKTLDSANMVLVLEPQQNYEDLSRTREISRKTSAELANKSNHNRMDELVYESSLHNNSSYILDSMRQILEETLDRIITSPGNIHNLSYHTIILSNDDTQKVNADRVTPPGITTNVGLVETSQGDIKNVLNRTFGTVLGDESTFSLIDTRLTVTDLDLLSFKSITSDSKYSEYYLADNEFNTSQEFDQVRIQNTSSVQDIFERKESHLNQTTPGHLAVQAFSGFSLDAPPVAGDQPDSIALIDSETGSLNVEINRQATSEEMFISGRSSESYESCGLDEDAVVPNWLFQLISQQHSVTENPEPVHLGPVAAPLDEPMYDANGNVIEPSMLGVGAGAGDGRGMHSDHSQDSSGRGTSLSSSDTSSGLQSEVSTVLIDPSAQFEVLRDPMTSSAVLPIDHSIDRTYTIEDEPGTLASAREERARTINGASDIDADISSIDTDVPDLSDN